MKINTKLMYVVAYRPTPRCRKDRYKEEYDTVDIELKEINSKALKPAFKVKDFIFSAQRRLRPLSVAKVGDEFVTE